VWGQMDDSLRDLRWIELEMESKRVQKNILTGKEEGIYGIGSHEKYIEYQNMIGFDFSDFYDKVINKKINDSVKTQEIIF
jgi:hypothetical protein